MSSRPYLAYHSTGPPPEEMRCINYAWKKMGYSGPTPVTFGSKEQADRHRAKFLAYKNECLAGKTTTTTTTPKPPLPIVDINSISDIPLPWLLIGGGVLLVLVFLIGRAMK